MASALTVSIPPAKRNIIRDERSKAGTVNFFAVHSICARVPHIVTPLFHHLLRFRLRVVSVLLAVFIANILTAGAGLTASNDWLEHEKSHLSALHDTESTDSPQSAPDKPAGKTPNKHDCHASHSFQFHVTTKPLLVSRAPSSLPPVSYVALTAPQGAAEAPFRPPR